MRKIFLSLSLLMGIGISSAVAQELFPFSEPASNMPSKSIGVRITNEFMKDSKHRFMPEVMIGHHKNLMSHGQAFFSNLDGKYKFEGLSAYAKYRFISIDEVQSHFRMATYTRVAWSKRPTYTEDLNLEGDNSGIQLGVIATQLIHKLAISGSVSYAAPFNDNSRQLAGFDAPSEHINYSLSTGYLLLPFVYKSYKQPNFNLYLEASGKTSLESGKSYLDLAPAIQAILNSRTRVDLGYNFQIAGGIDNRFKRNMVMLRAEFNFFNALK